MRPSALLSTPSTTHSHHPPPVPEDLDPQLYGVIDRTFVPCCFSADKPELYIGKHKTTGHNLQAITDQSGNIVVIFKPYIGSVYDLTTLHETRNGDAGCPGSKASGCR